MKAWQGALWTAGLLSSPVLGSQVYNVVMNNHSVRAPEVYYDRRPSGFGFIEYSRQKGGRQTVFDYSGLKVIDGNFVVLHDYEGDGLVDLIASKGSRFESPKREEILSRFNDYKEHTAEFDEADQKLQNLMARFPEKPS